MRVRFSRNIQVGFIVLVFLVGFRAAQARTVFTDSFSSGDVGKRYSIRGGEAVFFE